MNKKKANKMLNTYVQFAKKCSLREKIKEKISNARSMTNLMNLSMRMEILNRKFHIPISFIKLIMKVQSNRCSGTYVVTIPWVQKDADRRDIVRTLNHTE